MSNYLKTTKSKYISPIAKDLKIAIVYANFNSNITKKMLAATTQALKSYKITTQNIICENVEGALEIPVALLALKRCYKLDVLIAIGCVIRGETYHFEVVSNTSAFSLAQLSLTLKIPVINGIITCNNLTQAKARINDVASHIAKAAVNSASLIYHLKQNKKVKNKLRGNKT